MRWLTPICSWSILPRHRQVNHRCGDRELSHAWRKQCRILLAVRLVGLAGRGAEIASAVRGAAVRGLADHVVTLDQMEDVGFQEFINPGGTKGRREVARLRSLTRLTTM